MAWIYLQGSEGLQSLYQSGSGQSPIVKSINTAKGSYSVECRPASYPLHRFGMILDTSNQKEKLTLFTEDSPARMSALLELEKAWTESALAYSVKQFDLFENVNLSSYSSKMCQESEDMCLRSGASLRRLATIAGMDSLAQQKSAQIISEIDGGYLPTPTAGNHARNKSTGKNAKIRLTLIGMARKNLWPTPRACEKGHSQKRIPSATKRYHSGQATLSEALNHVMNGGALNPTWVEWLMGYPLEWTALEGWAMQWFRSKRGKRLKS